MNEIHQHYLQAEYEADWAEARAKHGDAATLADLGRTDAQRRADALARIFDDAAGAPPGTTAPKIVHNIVWSADTYLALAGLLGADADRLDPHWSANPTDRPASGTCGVTPTPTGAPPSTAWPSIRWSSSSPASSTTSAASSSTPKASSSTSAAPPASSPARPAGGPTAAPPLCVAGL